MTTPEGGREAGTAVFVTLEAPGGGESVESVEEYEPAERERLERDAKEIIARYPKPRSALLPMLHLVQSADGYVSRRGIEFCAEQLGITPAQVTGSPRSTRCTSVRRSANTMSASASTRCARSWAVTRSGQS